MGDANVRRPVATRFEHGVDFGLLVHKSPFMADKRDPLVLSNYIFELLEVNPGVAGFLIQLHTEDVDAVVESVTAHAERGAGTNPPFHSFALLQLSKPSRSSLLTMSQHTMSQLASLASRPDPAADTLAHYQALPVAHHQLDEATYDSEALGVDDIVGWAASLDPSPDVIHIDMRSPTRNSYLGGRGWATTLWRELRHQLTTLKFLHLTPLPSSVDQLLNSMRNNPVGKPKDAHV